VPFIGYADDLLSSLHVATAAASKERSARLMVWCLCDRQRRSIVALARV